MSEKTTGTIWAHIISIWRELVYLQQIKKLQIFKRSFPRIFSKSRCFRQFRKGQLVMCKGLTPKSWSFAKNWHAKLFYCSSLLLGLLNWSLFKMFFYLKQTLFFKGLWSNLINTNFRGKSFKRWTHVPFIFVNFCVRFPPHQVQLLWTAPQSAECVNFPLVYFCRHDAPTSSFIPSWSELSIFRIYIDWI